MDALQFREQKSMGARLEAMPNRRAACEELVAG
jgi:hypothetical protein